MCLFTGSALQGQPLDTIDSVCKEYSSCIKCNSMNGCSGSENYTLSIVPLTDSYTCNSLTSCGMDRCHCSASFGINLARAIIDNNLEVDSQFQNVDRSSCPRKGALFSVKNSCCGNAPFGKLYDSTNQVCDNGVVENKNWNFFNKNYCNGVRIKKNDFLVVPKFTNLFDLFLWLKKYHSTFTFPAIFQNN